MGLSLSDPMAELISEYLSRFIEPYSEISVADLVKEAHSHGALFVAGDGVLGLKPIKSDLWEVLFFVSESKETRKNLIRKASEKLGKISVTFLRCKHNDRSRTYSPRFWEKLLV